MIPVWNDGEAFQRHLENMREFRRAHHNNQRSVLIALNDIPSPCYARQNNNAGRDILLLNARGKPFIVPIWKIEPVEGSQN